MTRLVGLLLAMACVLAGCEQPPTPVSTEGADAFVRKVLDAVAAGNAETLYDAYFTPELKNRMSKAEWTTFAENYRELLGPVKTLSREATLGTLREEGFASATLQYRVTWEKLSGAVYVSLFKEADGWKLNEINYILPAETTPADRVAPLLNSN